MFSGIVQKKASVISAAKNGGVLRVAVEKPRGWKFKKGDSVAIDGICSTVIVDKRGRLEVEYMTETIRATTAGDFQAGRVVNLERSLRLGEELHGHFVQGHVDAIGIVKKVQDTEITIRIPKTISKLIAHKGSVAVNGVSLTVSKKEGELFTVALIPLTLSSTNLSDLKKGTKVNIETDMLVRYLDSLRRQ